MNQNPFENPNPHEEQEDQVKNPDVLSEVPKIDDQLPNISLTPKQQEELGELARKIQGEGFDENPE